MKSYRSGSKSGVFLMELVFAILFFALASAICIQLFIRAHLNNVRSSDLGIAATIVQSAAESYKAAPDPSDQFSSTLYYNENGQPMDAAEGATYRLVHSLESNAGLSHLSLSVYRVSGTPEETAEPLCSITAARYDG